MRKQYSEFLGFKIKLIKRKNKYVICSHMSDKSKQRAKEMLKRSIISIDKNGENAIKKINQINSQIMGLPQYYCTATMITMILEILLMNLVTSSRTNLIQLPNEGNLNNHVLNTSQIHI